MEKYVIGMDYGTLSARAILVRFLIKILKKRKRSLIFAEARAWEFFFIPTKDFPKTFAKSKIRPFFFTIAEISPILKTSFVFPLSEHVP